MAEYRDPWQVDPPQDDKDSVKFYLGLAWRVYQDGRKQDAKEFLQCALDIVFAKKPKS